MAETKTFESSFDGNLFFNFDTSKVEQFYNNGQYDFEAIEKNCFDSSNYATPEAKTALKNEFVKLFLDSVFNSFFLEKINNDTLKIDLSDDDLTTDVAKNNSSFSYKIPYRELVKFINFKTDTTGFLSVSLLQLDSPKVLKFLKGKLEPQTESPDLTIELIPKFTITFEQVVKNLKDKFELLINSSKTSWFTREDPFDKGPNDRIASLFKSKFIGVEAISILANYTVLPNTPDQIETIKRQLRNILGIAEASYLICPESRRFTDTTGKEYYFDNSKVFPVNYFVRDQDKPNDKDAFQARSDSNIKFSYNGQCMLLVSPATTLENLNNAGFTGAVEVLTDPQNQNNPTPLAISTKEAITALDKLKESFNRYEQQCVLLKLIEKISSKVVAVNDASFPKSSLPYSNFVPIELPPPSSRDVLSEITAFTNKLNTPPDSLPFVRLPNHVASALMPKIRLFKTYSIKEGDTVKKVDLELPLESYVSSKDILDGGTARSVGFGLKSFTWDNTSFNEYDRNISATLILKFNSLDSFVQERNGFLDAKQLTKEQKEEFKKFRFLELIYQVPSKVNDSDSRVASDNDLAAKYQLNQKFKIKVALGWAYDGNVLQNVKGGNSFKDAIDSNNIIYYLYNKGHDLNFEKDGSVTLTIYFQSAQEAYTNDEFEANIFLDAATKSKLAELRQKYSEIQSKIETQNDEKEQATLKDQLSSLQKEELNYLEKNSFEIYKKFIDQMYSKHIVEIMELPVEDVYTLKTNLSLTARGKPLNPVFRNYNDSLQGINNVDQLRGKISQLKEGIEVRMASGTAIIPYFYFGDLLNLIIENINSSANGPNLDKEKIRLLTGPLAVKSQAALTSKEIELSGKKGEIAEDSSKPLYIIQNIAEVPISFSFFLDWFEETIIKNRTTKYTFRQFLNDVVTKFIVSALNPNCFGSRYKFQPTPKVDVFILNATEGPNQTEKLTSAPLSSTFGNKRVGLADAVKVLNPVNNFKDLSNTNLVSYIYIQCIYNDPLLQNEFINEEEDAKKGVYHLRLGSDRGLVKNIVFSKDDMPNIPVAIYQQQGLINPKVLRVPYNAEVEMIGNTIFKPGSKVYIDPTFALRNPSNSEYGSDPIRFLGLGGYYVVTRAVSSIRPGSFETKINCRFTSYGNPKPPETKRTKK
jgi:hypothetical protein